MGYKEIWKKFKGRSGRGRKVRGRDGEVSDLDHSKYGEEVAGEFG